MLLAEFGRMTRIVSRVRNCECVAWVEHETRRLTNCEKVSGHWAGDVPDVLDGGIIDWSELERAGKGIIPIGFVEEIDVINRGSERNIDHF